MESLIGREMPIHVTKYDGTYHPRWPVRYVLQRGSLFVTAFPIGTLTSAVREPTGDGDVEPAPYGGDVYLWSDRWYNVSRVLRDGRIYYYVNIATPVEFDGESFRYVDLDLDVAWYTDEAPRVLDEDEFLDHSKAMRYPAGVIERARAAVDEVLGLIGERAFPFDRP